MRQLRVSVVGGGVSALTTAAVLAECGHDVRLHFVRLLDDAATDACHAFAHQAAHTTSGAAAAFWTPFSVGVYQRRWAVDSLYRFQGIAQQGARNDTGVFLGTLKMLFPSRDAAEAALAGALWWTRIPSTRVDPAAPTAVERADPPSMVDGAELAFAVRARVPIVDVTRYLPWLSRYAANSGVTFAASVQPLGLSEAAAGRDAVVACGGYETPAMLTRPDELAMHPLVGILMAGRPESRSGRDDVVKAATGDPSRPAYVVQAADEKLSWLGGTVLEVRPDRVPEALLEPPPDEVQRIRRQCEQMIGPVACEDAEGKLSIRMGARPFRERVRVEIVEEPLPGDVLAVANYGHGGAGVTLSWGCAAEVLRIVEETLGRPATAADAVDLSRMQLARK